MVRIACMECDTSFKRKTITANTKCPKCGSYDLEVIS